jgi:hypothetical protein
LTPVTVSDRRPASSGLAGRHRGGGHPQLEAEPHESLLRAVVQVALDPPPLLVAGRHDPGPGGGKLRAAVGVRDRRGHELGELRDARLGDVRQQRVPVRGRGDDHSPQPGADHDRGADRGADAEVAKPRGDRPAGAGIGVDAGRLAALMHPRRDAVALERHARADRYVCAVLAPPRDDRGGVVAVVPEHVRHVGLQLPAA